VATELLTSPPPAVTADRAYLSCLAAIGIIEVTCRSLEYLEVTHEPAALQAAAREIWTAHDYLFPLCSESDGDRDGGDVS
jgi:hypothetical protein